MLQALSGLVGSYHQERGDTRQIKATLEEYMRASVCTRHMNLHFQTELREHRFRRSSDDLDPNELLENLSFFNRHVLLPIINTREDKL